MSINYVLYMAGPWKPRDAIQELTRGVPVPRAPPVSRVEETTAIEYLWVVATVPPVPVNQYVREDHGFLPTLRLQIRLDKAHLLQAQDNLLNLVSQILLGSPEDVVLLREDEHVALRRLGGQLELPDDALWASAERRSRAERLLRA